MGVTEFIHRANYGHLVTNGVTFNGSKSLEVLRRAGRASGYWHHCAPLGAQCSCPSDLPIHGPSVCGKGSYAA